MRARTMQMVLYIILSAFSVVHAIFSLNIVIFCLEIIADEFVCQNVIKINVISTLNK